VTAPVQMIVAKPAAPKPAKTLGKDATCVYGGVCHTSAGDIRQIHGPVSEKSCLLVSPGGHRGAQVPAGAAGNATCTFCHAVSGTMSHQHKAIEQGCTSCHQPHVSNAKFLLKADSVEQLCAKCHRRR
jgi:predicted CXXCH cytochrome family protein